MHLTNHAIRRIGQRIRAQGATVARLEALVGEPGTVAYLLNDDRERGAVVVAIAVDGSVETVYFRRAKQDLSAAFFGARKVIDMRSTP